MKITVISIFPQMFDCVFSYGIVQRAREKRIVELNFLNLVDFAASPKEVDDYPYGGGPGMVIKPDVVKKALESAGEGFKIFLTPKGKVFDQKLANELAKKEHLVLFAARYKGIDERARKFFDMELSIGDYVLSGGELPAMVIMDAVIRLIEGVAGNKDSVLTDSFQNGLLSYPVYTRPREFEGEKVPEVLLSGNHKEIERFRKKMAIRETLLKRPELLLKRKLTEEEIELLLEILKEAKNEQ